jgi:hypothetical protein
MSSTWVAKNLLPYQRPISWTCGQTIGIHSAIAVENDPPIPRPEYSQKGRSGGRSETFPGSAESFILAQTTARIHHLSRCLSRHATTNSSSNLSLPLPPLHRLSPPYPTTVPAATLSLSPTARLPHPSSNPRFASTRLRSTRTAPVRKNGPGSHITASQMNQSSFIAPSGVWEFRH